MGIYTFVSGKWLDKEESMGWQEEEVQKRKKQKEEEEKEKEERQRVWMIREQKFIEVLKKIKEMNDTLAPSIRLVIRETPQGELCQPSTKEDCRSYKEIQGKSYSIRYIEGTRDSFGLARVIQGPSFKIFYSDAENAFFIKHDEAAPKKLSDNFIDILVQHLCTGTSITKDSFGGAAEK